MSVKAIGVLCPLCGDTTGTATVTIDPGEREITSGPPDTWHPGSPPGIDQIEDLEWDCDCRQQLSDLFAYPLPHTLLWHGQQKTPRDFALQWYDASGEDNVSIDLVPEPDLDYDEPDHYYED